MMLSEPIFMHFSVRFFNRKKKKRNTMVFQSVKHVSFHSGWQQTGIITRVCEMVKHELCYVDATPNSQVNESLGVSEL